MTDPEDPFASNPFSYDPLGRAPLPRPPAFAPPPPPPPPPPVNALATLSLVFAFVFAPAGAVLGHLGLAQIRHTGERGRDRALLGMAVSYAIIASTVLAVLAWAVFAALSPARGPTAVPPPATTSTAPAGPTVEPAAVAALLPGVDALKSITGDASLEAGPTRDSPPRPEGDDSVSPAECWGSIAPGSPEAYPSDSIAGYHAAKISDTRTLFKSLEIVQAVVAFRDASAAQSQLATLLAGWRRCSASTVWFTVTGVGPVPYSLSGPADAGNGISTLDLTPKGPRLRTVHAIAAKANVIVDLCVTDGGTTDAERARQSAIGIANYVLGKIPG